MKRNLISVLFLLVICFNIFIQANAYSDAIESTIISDGSKVILYEDGTSLTITAPRIIATMSTPSKSLQTITAQIDTTFADSNGETEWIYTLTCTFSYEYGVSSVCTNASYTQTIYKGNWTFSNGATSISGNRGNGTGLFEKKFLFITVQSINVQLTLACDIYGNVTA